MEQHHHPLANHGNHAYLSENDVQTFTLAEFTGLTEQVMDYLTEDISPLRNLIYFKKNSI